MVAIIFSPTVHCLVQPLTNLQSIQKLLVQFSQGKWSNYQERKFFYISQKTSPSLRLSVFPTLRHYDILRKNLPSTFIYELILMKIYMNANIVKMQIVYIMMYGLRGHWKHHKVVFLFKNPLFLQHLICLISDLKDHWRSLLILWKEIVKKLILTL